MILLQLVFFMLGVYILTGWVEERRNAAIDKLVRDYVTKPDNDSLTTHWVQVGADRDATPKFPEEKS